MRSTQAIIIARASLGKTRKLVLMYPLTSNPVEDVAVVTDRFGITPNSGRVEGKRIWTWEVLMEDPWSGRTIGLYESASDFKSFELNQRLTPREPVNLSLQGSSRSSLSVKHTALHLWARL